MELVGRRRQVTVEEAAAALGVSQATVRRDLEQLARQRLITRTRGGAVANGVAYDLPLPYKTARHSSEKQRIGAAAAALVEPGMVIGLGGGTTAIEVARSVAARPELASRGDTPQLTVVTNALNIANELLVRSTIKIVLAGGEVRPQSSELVGPLGAALLQQVALDLAVLGVDAIDPKAGAAGHHEGEAAMTGLLANLAARVVIVADASKLGRRAFARICPIDRVATLVTDTGASPAAVAAFESAGVHVISA